MPDEISAEDTFAGQFELRNWNAELYVAGNDTVAAEVGMALASCEGAVLALAIQAPQRVGLAGGPTELRTPIAGDLRIDSNRIPFKGQLDPKNPGEASGSLEITKSARWLQFDLERRRSRVTATLFARRHDDRSAPLRVFFFYRVGSKGPPRRAPEKTPVPIVAEPSPPKPVTPSVDPPGVRIAAEWTKRLTNTRLSYTNNDFDAGYGSSTYIEWRTALQLHDRYFVYERTTTTRVMQAHTKKQEQLAGRWYVPATGNALVAQLHLESDQGQRMVFQLASPKPGSILVDGIPWKWTGA